MKRIIFSIILLSIVVSIFSQSNFKLTESNKEEYFEKNILTLDPIEGIYDVQLTQQGSNSYQTFPSSTDNFEFTIYKTADGVFRMLGNNPNYIERIGETNTYTYHIIWDDIQYVDKKRIYLNEGAQFQVSYDIPQKQLKHDLGRKYQRGDNVKFSFDHIKKYPTYSMYNYARNQYGNIQKQNNLASDSQFYYNQALLKQENNDYEGAYVDFNKSIELDPNKVEAYYFRGMILQYIKRNFDLAINDFTKCIQMKPDVIESFFQRGRCFHEQKRNIEAIKDFTECLKFESENTDALFMRALNKSELNDRQGAINDYDAILKVEDKSESTVYKISTVYNNIAFSLVEMGKYSEALPLVNKALDLDKTEWYIWDTRGEIYYNLNEFEKCIKDMNEAISIQEADNSYYIRGLAKIKLDKKKDGCADLSKAGELGKFEAYEAIEKYCN